MHFDGVSLQPAYNHAFQPFQLQYSNDWATHSNLQLFCTHQAVNSILLHIRPFLLTETYLLIHSKWGHSQVSHRWSGLSYRNLRSLWNIQLNLYNFLLLCKIMQLYPIIIFQRSNFPADLSFYSEFHHIRNLIWPFQGLWTNLPHAPSYLWPNLFFLSFYIYFMLRHIFHKELTLRPSVSLYHPRAVFFLHISVFYSHLSLLTLFKQLNNLNPLKLFMQLFSRGMDEDFNQHTGQLW